MRNRGPGGLSPSPRGRTVKCHHFTAACARLWTPTAGSKQDRDVSAEGRKLSCPSRPLATPAWVRQTQGQPPSMEGQATSQAEPPPCLPSALK